MGKLFNKLEEIDSWIMDKKKGFIYTVNEHVLVYILLVIAIICAVFDITHWGKGYYTADAVGLAVIGILLFMRNNAKKRGLK
jgi:hypothetical protein